MWRGTITPNYTYEETAAHDVICLGQSSWWPWDFEAVLEWSAGWLVLLWMLTVSYGSWGVDSRGLWSMSRKFPTGLKWWGWESWWEWCITHSNHSREWKTGITLWKSSETGSLQRSSLRILVYNPGTVESFNLRAPGIWNSNHESMESGIQFSNLWTFRLATLPKPYPGNLWNQAWKRPGNWKGNSIKLMAFTALDVRLWKALWVLGNI